MRDRNRVKQEKLARRRRRVRRKISGTAERPRLSVSRSLKHVRAQLVDDAAQRTIIQVSSTAAGLALSGDGSAKMKRSEAVGRKLAELAQEKGIKLVTFDRGGRLYHGRIKAVAEAARKGGLDF
jgi:large subunit ribosomal protein L18